MVQRAFAAGQKAGPLNSPLDPVSLSQINAPIRPTDEEEPEISNQSIPGYRIFREISSGGQATVFKAIQESTGKSVAIKILPGGSLAGSRNRGRFNREAEILAKLDHPNIVGIVDRGIAGDGSHYLVMQYVDGRPLDEFADECRREGREGIRRLINVLIVLARSVGDAHANKVIHRDLKPSNILIDFRDQPHLLDFGLARLEGDFEHDWRARTITVAGQIVGSLPWTSPEQVDGKSVDVDARCDVYALGVCFYQAITGRHPYLLSGSIPELIARIQSLVPPRIEAMPGLRGDGVQRVIEKCLAKEPRNRYGNASVLALELEAALAGRPLARVPGARRRQLLIVVASICIAASLAGFRIYLKQRPAGPSLGKPPAVAFDLPSSANSIGMTLLKIPRGQFLMGTPDNTELRGDDERSHSVTITRPFWMSNREVNRAQYASIMELAPPRAAEASLPITGITWLEAQEFCRRLSEREEAVYRLPTEAEWEYACRAGTSVAWSGSGLAGDMGWHGGNSGNVLHPTGQKHRNHWGLYDMHGNAAEWCADAYFAVYPMTSNDPYNRGLEASPRCVRGGSYSTAVENTRSASRNRADPGEARDDIGFRVVREEPVGAIGDRISATGSK